MLHKVFNKNRKIEPLKKIYCHRLMEETSYIPLIRAFFFLVNKSICKLTKRQTLKYCDRICLDNVRKTSAL